MDISPEEDAENFLTQMVDRSAGWVMAKEESAIGEESATLGESAILVIMMIMMLP